MPYKPSGCFCVPTAWDGSRLPKVVVAAEGCVTPGALLQAHNHWVSLHPEPSEAGSGPIGWTGGDSLLKRCGDGAFPQGMLCPSVGS